MLKPLSVALSFAASTALAQTQPAQTAPTVTPSQTPAVTPAPAASTGPVLGGPPPALGSIPVGGMSPCENMIGAERDKCRQADSAAAGATTQPPATPSPQTPPPTYPVR